VYVVRLTLLVDPHLPPNPRGGVFLGFAYLRRGRYAWRRRKPLDMNIRVLDPPCSFSSGRIEVVRATIGGNLFLPTGCSRWLRCNGTVRGGVRVRYDNGIDFTAGWR
jgi:hypothetical protein